MSTVSTSSHFDPQPGTIVDGKYRCEQMLGVGGMGAVVRATHLLRQAPVALKFMNANLTAKPAAVGRFVNEAVAASRIDCENVVKIFDVGRLTDGAPYLVMEYLEGEELGSLLGREGHPGLDSIQRAVHFTLQILRALQVAHDAGIVHRDMKPANCFVVNRDGEPDFVKILDFGISKIEQLASKQLTSTQAMLGTPLYMAPEQARSAKRADARTDLYATGVILYELLSGRTPFQSEDDGLAGLMALVLTGDPTPLGTLRKELPTGLEVAIHKVLARDPSGRYQNSAEMAAALAPFADERSQEVIARIRRRAASRGEPSLPPPKAMVEAALGEAALRPAPLPRIEPGPAVVPEPSPVEPGRELAGAASPLEALATSLEAPATKPQGPAPRPPTSFHSSTPEGVASTLAATAPGVGARRNRMILPIVLTGALALAAVLSVYVLSSPAAPGAEVLTASAATASVLETAATAASGTEAPSSPISASPLPASAPGVGTLAPGSAAVAPPSGTSAAARPSASSPRTQPTATASAAATAAAPATASTTSSKVRLNAVDITEQ